MIFDIFEKIVMWVVEYGYLIEPWATGPSPGPLF